MDRQRAAVVGVAAALVMILVLGVGFVAGRASAEDTSPAGGSADGDGLPAGPGGLDDGVPVGFAQSEQGALSAALAWVPWLLTTPVSDRPEGIETVLAEGVEPPIPDNISLRLQFVPWAARVTMSSNTEAEVTLLGTPLGGEVGDDLDGGLLPVPTTLVWDDQVGDWRVSAIEMDSEYIDVPVQAEDVSGYRVVRPYGGVLGGVLMEEVPGD